MQPPSVIWKTDPAYPPLLHETSHPPKRLFCLGEPPNPADTYFAVVGTRRPSPYGREMAEEFTATLAAEGFVIVSGLAYGIDAIAHEAALKTGGRTIAVLGAGFNHISPPCNIELSRRIQKNGCLLTEYEADLAPHKGTFPQRNRIIAGISCATLVVEAPEKSGALITARLALEYNRDVFTIPGNITQETSRGANQLIRDGKAFPVTCIQDIFDFMACGWTARKQENPAQTPRGLDETEEKIYVLLKNAPLSIDQLAEETKLPAPQIAAAVSMLELKGIVKTQGSYAFVTR